MQVYMEDYKCLSNENEVRKFDIITAASLGDLRLVQQMLKKGNCDPNVTNNSGWTSLMYAAHYGHYNVVRMLIDHKAAVDLKEWVNGRTALMFAASNGHTRCIEILVNHGYAQIDLTDFSGKTAAYYATHYGHGNNKIIVKMLGIKDNRQAPRAITNFPRSKPKITVTEFQRSGKKAPGAERQLSDDRGGQCNQQQQKPTGVDCYQARQSGDSLPFLHYATLRDNKSPSRDSVDSNNHHHSSSDDHTPVHFNLSANRGARPKRLQLDTSTENLSVVSADSSNSWYSSEDTSPGSPPLPTSLENLLNRLQLRDEYYQLFENNGIDLYLFLSMTESDLISLGVTTFGHRRKLVTAQQRFRESIEIKDTQERFFADWLLHEREEFKDQLRHLKAKNEELLIRLAEFENQQRFESVVTEAIAQPLLSSPSSSDQ